jgi:hypothetical protein
VVHWWTPSSDSAFVLCACFLVFLCVHTQSSARHATVDTTHTHIHTHTYTESSARHANVSVWLCGLYVCVCECVCVWYTSYISQIHTHTHTHIHTHIRVPLLWHFGVHMVCTKRTRSQKEGEREVLFSGTLLRCLLLRTLVNISIGTHFCTLYTKTRHISGTLHRNAHARRRRNWANFIRDRAAPTHVCALSPHQTAAGTFERSLNQIYMYTLCICIIITAERSQGRC